MAVTIPDDFCGYVMIEKNRYTYCVNGHFVKLLPVFEGGENQENQSSLIIGLSPQSTGQEDNFHYIYGYDESLHQIALLQAGNPTHSMFDVSISFFAPVIIKSEGNASGFYDKLTKDWKKYDAIKFAGGIIDALYNPKAAALKRLAPEEMITQFENNSGAHSIEIMPFAEYTHEISIEIDGQNANLVLSVWQSRDDSNMSTTDLGSLTSFIQLQFENPQDFITIHRYILIIKAMLAVFARQNNINFDVSIKQKAKNEKYMGTSICKVYMENEDFYLPKSPQIVSLLCLFDHLPQIIRIIARGEAETILALLPERNRDSKRISIVNVQDLCTALEAEYNLFALKTPTVKDAAIQQLKKKIKATIKAFAEENECIDTNKETNIGSCFQYLDLNLKSKIFSLYQQHKITIDSIIQKRHLPEMTVESIGRFVKLRNTRAHTGKITWGNSADLFLPLMALVYACFLARAEVESESIPSILSQIF